MIIDKNIPKQKIELQCEDCGKNRVVQRNSDITAKSEHPCRPCSNKRNGLNKRGKPSWNSNRRMPENERKVGSTYINHHGYVEFYVGPQTAANYGRKDGYVLEHRKIVQDKIGRPLIVGEIIHHLDGDKQNNVDVNLFLCNSTGHHRDVHTNLESIAFELFKSGVIGFHNGEYFAKN